MTRSSCWKKICLVCALLAMTVIVSSAQTFKTVANFNGTDGSYPGYLSLVQGTDGNLYGTTEGGGPERGGTIFKMTPSGVLTTIYTFCDQSGDCPNGAYPYAGLALGTDEVFYGTTFQGGPSILCLSGCGTVFKVTRAGVLATLHTFALTDGGNPSGSLIQGSDGDLYGTTEFGGAGSCANLYTPGCGTIFKINSKLGFTTLHSFNGADGWNPLAGLIQGFDGNFYGTTLEGGAYGGGTVFRITSEGKLTTLYNFCAQTNCTDGEFPAAALLQATDGNFYGTTAGGGTGYCYYDEQTGTIFKMNPSGALTTLHSFCLDDGFVPEAALIQATDANLYGTTYEGGNGKYCVGAFTPGCGTAFKLVQNGTLTTLHRFCSQTNCADGSAAEGGLFQATNGTFYGTTLGGGAGGEGIVFWLDGGLGPFVKNLPTSGMAGRVVKILGTDLTGATSITFNGMPAAFTVVSGTEISTTVPTGATTGTVQVVTPSGTLSSNVPFRVTK